MQRDFKRERETCISCAAIYTLTVGFAQPTQEHSSRLARQRYSVQYYSLQEAIYYKTVIGRGRYAFVYFCFEL